MIPRSRTWQEFTKDPKNSKLPINEQKRLYEIEQDKWRRYMEYVNSNLFNNKKYM